MGKKHETFWELRTPFPRGTSAKSSQHVRACTAHYGASITQEKRGSVCVSRSSHRSNLSGVALSMDDKTNDEMNLVSFYLISKFSFLHFLEEKYSGKWQLYSNTIQFSATYTLLKYNNTVQWNVPISCTRSISILLWYSKSTDIHCDEHKDVRKFLSYNWVWTWWLHFSLVSPHWSFRFGCTCQRRRLHRLSSQDHRNTQAPPPRQGGSLREGMFFFVFVFTNVN